MVLLQELFGRLLPACSVPAGFSQQASTFFELSPCNPDVYSSITSKVPLWVGFITNNRRVTSSRLLPLNMISRTNLNCVFEGRSGEAPVGTAQPSDRQTKKFLPGTRVV